MIRLRQVKVALDNRDNLLNKVAQILRIKKEDILRYKIVKESIDARKKDNILFTYEIDVEVKKEKDILRENNSNDIFQSPLEKFEFKITGTETMNYRPIIVGAGPAGLLCAYLLAEHGYNPIVIENADFAKLTFSIVSIALIIPFCVCCRRSLPWFIGPRK